MQQYQAIKSRYPHALLLFRLGDFYELFYEDAILASRELQITLTSRNREKGQPIPMCGVPYHAADGYIARLIRAGFKVAICDQMEQPGPGKKLVRREVVRVITPGTATDVAVLDAQENNFLASVSQAHLGNADRPGLRRSLHRRISIHGISPARAPKKPSATNCRLLHPRETLLPRPQHFSKRRKTSLLDGAGGVETRSTTGSSSTTTPNAFCANNSASRNSPASVSTIIRRPLPPPAPSFTTSARTPRSGRRCSQRRRPAPPRSRSLLRTARRAGARSRLRPQPRTPHADLFRRDSGAAGPTTLVAALDVTVTGMGARLLRFLDSSSAHRSGRHRSAPRRGRRISSSKPLFAAKFAKSCAAFRISNASRAASLSVWPPRELVALAQIAGATSGAAEFPARRAPTAAAICFAASHDGNRRT